MVGPVDQLINRWLNSWSDYFVTGFGWNGTSDLGVDRLPETKKMFKKQKIMNVPYFLDSNTETVERRCYLVIWVLR